MISIKAGEAKPFYFSITQKDTGLGIDLSDSKILFQVKEKENQNCDFLFDKEISAQSSEEEAGKIYEPSRGKFSIFFKSEDTLNLNVDKDYFYTIWRISGSLKEVISSSGDKTEVFDVCPA